MSAMQHDTFQPLGDSPVLTFELRAASEDNIPTRNKAHLEAERTIADKLEDGDVSLNIETGKIGSSTTTIVEGLLSPPSTPPRLRSRSPRDSLRKSPGTMQALDDSYCDRIRSKSSFGWYDESAAFESMDAPPHPACCQIDDWRNLETWEGGKKHERQDENNPDVEFEVPHAHVTATKTFRHASHGRPDSYALALGATRVIRVSPYASHAQYQVLLSAKDGVHKSWKRFSDFKLLAEYAKISNLPQSVAAWREVQQTRRWFRCLEANYLKTKCKLLERFLAQLLFEVPTPSLLLTFVGAGQPDFVKNDNRGGWS